METSITILVVGFFLCVGFVLLWIWSKNYVKKKEEQEKRQKEFDHKLMVNDWLRMYRGWSIERLESELEQEQLKSIKTNTAILKSTPGLYSDIMANNEKKISEAKIDAINKALSEKREKEKK